MRQHIGEGAHEHAHLAMERRDPAKGARRLTSMFDKPEDGHLPAQERHRRERREPGERTTGTAPGPPPPCGVRERLVEIDVHGIDAETARPRLAHDRVEIRPVAVEIGSGLMHQGGDFDDVLLEQPQASGFVNMIAATSGPSLLDGGRGQGCHRHAPERAHLKPALAAEAGLVPCAELRHENGLAGVPPSPRSPP